MTQNQTDIMNRKPLFALPVNLTGEGGVAPKNFRRLRDRLEADLASVLAADLAANGAAGLYVVTTAETSLRPDGWFAGLHHPQLHRWLRTDLVGRWVGDGPAVLVDTSRLCKVDGETAFVGTSIHEMAHALDTPGLFAKARDEDGSERQFVRAELFESYVNAPLEPETSSVRDGHGWQWLRLCIHLTHRMNALGWEIPLPFVINREHYDYSPTSDYRRALGDEPTRLESLPLTTIQHIDPPRQFTQLWESDCAMWPGC